MDVKRSRQESYDTDKYTHSKFLGHEAYIHHRFASPAHDNFLGFLENWMYGVKRHIFFPRISGNYSYPKKIFMQNEQGFGQHVSLFFILTSSCLVWCCIYMWVSAGTRERCNTVRKRTTNFFVITNIKGTQSSVFWVGCCARARAQFRFIFFIKLFFFTATSEAPSLRAPGSCSLPLLSAEPCFFLNR